MLTENNKHIYLSPPHIGDQEWTFIKDALESNWIAPLGPHVDAFEQEVGDYIGGCSAVALASGTAALHLALKLTGVQPGDRVFCSDLTFVASANVILYEHAIPVFIDADPATWTMCPQALQKALTAATEARQLPRAVIVSDLYGQSADYDAIKTLCIPYDIPVIEDAAEAVGAEYKGRKCGNFGTMAIFSFNGNKIITTSGGGMLLSADSDLVDQARFLATQARDPARHYEHSKLGYNYRLSNLLAALGRGQLRSLDDHVATCRIIYQHYQDELAARPGIKFMPLATYGRSTCWLTACTIDPQKAGVDKDELIRTLEAANIEARPLWKPMHLQPLFNDVELFTTSRPSVAAELFHKGLCLPSGSGLLAEDQQQVITLLKRTLA